MSKGIIFLLPIRDKRLDYVSEAFSKIYRLSCVLTMYDLRQDQYWGVSESMKSDNNIERVNLR